MPGEALRVTGGLTTGQEMAVEREVQFGREAGGFGALGNDPDLSRRHARIVRKENGALQIEDLGSTGGTFVNGTRITGPHPLVAGDRIRLGGSTIEVEGSARATAAGQGLPDADHTVIKSRPSILQLRLKLTAGPDASREFIIVEPTVIGREEGADIVLTDREVSRRHAQLIPVDDTAVIEDLGSSNGTFVNGQPLTSPRRLRTHDRIVIGETVLELVIPSHDGATPGEAAPAGPVKRDNGIVVQGLVREFGDFIAVAGIELNVEPGEIYGFLGPNGAGKSTTVHMLTTLLPPTRGTALIAGHDIVKEGPAVRRNIGVALQAAALDPYMDAWEHMELQTTLQGVPKNQRRKRAEDLIERVKLTYAADRKVGSYSGGMKRRLDLALSLVHDPIVIFLDEPTTGLDPQSRSDLWEEVRRLAKDEGVTVFLTTQYLEEADVLADRVGIIDGGKLVVEDTPDALKRQVGRPTVVAYAADPAQRPHLHRILLTFGAEAEQPDRIGVGVRLREGIDDLAAIVRAVDAESIRLDRLDLHAPTLDDVFLAKTGRSLEENEEAQEKAIKAANAAVNLPGQPVEPLPAPAPLVPR